MNWDFSNKTVVISGGSSGLGKACALEFAKLGANVSLADLDEENGKKCVKEITSSGMKAIFTKCDVSEEHDVLTWINHTIETFGGFQLAVNAAGIEDESQAITNTSLETWNRILKINLTGTWLCMKHQIKHLLETEKPGSIVNIGSVLGVVGGALATAYSASKGGVLQLTRSAALEYAKKNIRINAICPGAIETPMLERIFSKNPRSKKLAQITHPIGRMGNAIEVAHAAIWLLSDNSSFTTGQAIGVDGGYLAQ